MTYRRSRERFLDYDRQLFIYRKGTLGEEHPDTLKAQGNMASTLRGLGRYEEALDCIISIN
jgi:hypothetical protein